MSTGRLVPFQLKIPAGVFKEDVEIIGFSGLHIDNAAGMGCSQLQGRKLVTIQKPYPDAALLHMAGEPEAVAAPLGEADDPSWEEWTDADSFGAAMEEKASQNPGQDFIWTANRWVTASRINDDPYDQYVSLTLMFNWPATGKATGKANGNAELQWTVSAVRDAS